MTEAPSRPPCANPWRTIWLSPRSTIRQAVQTKTWRAWLPVIVLAVPVWVLGLTQSVRSDPSLVSESTIEILLSSVKFLFYLLVLGPFVIALVGRLLGGTARPSAIRHAVMWSHIPLIVASVFWIPVILSVGLEVFREAQTGFTAELAIWTTYAARVWSLVILVVMLAEVQGFSIVRTIVELITHWCGLVVYIAAVNFLGRVLGLM